MTRFASASRVVTAAVLLFTGILPLACSSGKPPGASALKFLDVIQQNRYVSVSLHAVMTYDDDHGNFITGPRDMNVYVPITWNGTTFSGNTSGSNTTNGDVVDSVHGLVTDDGTWAEHIDFWRTVVGNQTNVPFYISLVALPIVDTIGGNTTSVGTFEVTADVQKHVQKIDCQQNGVYYVSTDWQNTAQPPVMKVRFDKENANQGN